MDKIFILEFVFKNLMQHKFRTILTLLGIVIGIAAIVFLVSFGFGLQRVVTEELTGGDNIYVIDVGAGKTEGVKLNDEMVNKIRQLSHVSKSELMITAVGKIEKDEKQFNTFAFFATTPTFMNLAAIKLKNGEFFAYDADKNPEKQMVVNQAFLDLVDKKNYLDKDIKMNIIIPQELTKSGLQEEIKEQEYKIVGLIQDDGGPAVYTDFRNVLTAEIVNYSQMKVQIDKKVYVADVRKQIDNLGFYTDYIGDTLIQIEQVFDIFKIILASFGFIAFLVAALGMFNILTISLLERIREVALLKILGMKKKEIKNIFIVESIMLGLFGGALGILAGIFFSNLGNSILNLFILRAGGDPVQVFWSPLSFLVLIFIFSFFVSFAVGWYPSRRATKVEPLDVFRYE